MFDKINLKTISIAFSPKPLCLDVALGKDFLLINCKYFPVFDHQSALRNHMLNMPRFDSENKVAIEIALIERCRRIIIKHNQVVWSMTCKTVAFQVFISIAETLVNTFVTYGIEILPTKNAALALRSISLCMPSVPIMMFSPSPAALK